MDDAAPSDATPPVEAETLGDEAAPPDNGDKDKDEAEEETDKPRGKTLEQMMSLKEGDDEQTQISKKISWILRHGARKVSIEIDSDGWVLISDLLEHSIMTGVTQERLMDIINESNKQKVRYELKEPEEDGATGQAVRAVSKHTISGMAGTLAREQRRVEREQRREARLEQKEQQRERGDRDDHGETAPPRSDAPRGDRRDENEEGSFRDGAYQGGWDRRDRPMKGQSTRDDDDGPTFEQQLEDGYRPVYQGNRVVAMVKEGHPHAVKPGRRARNDYKGKGDFKGYGKDYGRDENYGGYGYYGGGGYGSYGGNRDDDRRGDFRGSKGSKDVGKGYRDRQDRGDGGREHGKYSSKGYDDSSYDRPRRTYNTEYRQHWRVCPGQEAIMRASVEMESQAIMTLPSGTLVVQTGDSETNHHGIVRMPVETVDGGARGWVTRTAEAANGPAFFRREAPPGKGYDSGPGYGGGKGGKGSKGGKGGNRGYGDGGRVMDRGGKGRSDYGQFSMG